MFKTGGKGCSVCPYFKTLAHDIAISAVMPTRGITGVRPVCLHIGGLACYAKTDEVYQTFMSHSEWWLRDDHGDAVQPLRIDVTNEQAVAWWISVPLGGRDGPQLVDGILADCAGMYTATTLSCSR